MAKDLEALDGLESLRCLCGVKMESVMAAHMVRLCITKGTM
jgi:hypothetical protein